MFGLYTLLGIGCGSIGGYTYAKYKKKEFHKKGFGPSDGGFTIFTSMLLCCSIGVIVDVIRYL